MKAKLMIRTVGIILVASAIVLRLVGCGSSSEQTHDLDDLRGLSLEQMIDKLGSPTMAQEYSIAQAPTKHWNHGILLKTYPKSNPMNRNILIEELTWDDGDYVIKACFHIVDHAWVVLAASRFHKDTRF